MDLGAIWETIAKENRDINIYPTILSTSVQLIC